MVWGGARAHSGENAPIRKTPLTAGLLPTSHQHHDSSGATDACKAPSVVPHTASVHTWRTSGPGSRCLRPQPGSE